VYRPHRGQKHSGQRIDYLQIDPPEWKKVIALKLLNGKINVAGLPHASWGNLKENYEAHNQGYKVVHTE
jgi:hypothetical protein